MLPETWHSKRRLKTTDATLGAVGGIEAIPQLVKALHHKKEAVRQAAAWALGEIGSPIPLPDLLAALHDPDWLTRRAAIIALGKIGDSAALPRLCINLAEENPDLRAESALAILKIAPADAPRLLESLLTDPAPTTLPKFEGQCVGDIIRNALCL